jgi:arylformamidase
MLYDLSPRVGAGTPVWPGDTPFSSRLTWSMAEGSPVNVSALTTTPHLGSHADAPFHTEPRGDSIADLPLEPFLGPCQVVKVPTVPRIEPRHLNGLLDGDGPLAPPRLLLRTGSVPDRKVFPERFTTLSPELAARLAEMKTLLVGLDTPSVDPLESKTLEAHHHLLRHGVAILEGLVLDGVPEGVYELIALPLKLTGLDASPVRAVLRTLEG